MKQDGSPPGRPSTALSAPSTPSKPQLLKTPDSPQPLQPLLPRSIPDLYLTRSRWNEIANAVLEVEDVAKNGAGPSHAPVPTQPPDADEMEANESTTPAHETRPLDILTNEGAAANYENGASESAASTQNGGGTQVEGNGSTMGSPKSHVPPASLGHATVPQGYAAAPEHSAEHSTTPEPSRTPSNPEYEAEYHDSDAEL